MSDPYVIKSELEELLMKLDDRFKSLEGGKTRIFWKSTPVTLSLTWDGTWYTYDFTSITSEKAKGVFLGVHLYRASGSNYTGYLYTAKYNNTAWEGIVRIRGESDGYEIGGTITQAIDNQQRMNYCGVVATGTVKLLGYWE